MREGRKFLDLEIPGHGVFICPSNHSSAAQISDEEIIDLYNKVANCTFENWNDYVSTKRGIFIIRPSTIYPAFYICSCPNGIKKRPCKHSVYVMTYLKKSLVNPYAISIQPKRGPGRPKKAKDALSIN
jgi:hypothetical protein